MANNGKKKCTLAFKSRGDLRSALSAAAKWGISVEKIDKESEHLISVPADTAIRFEGLGSINFWIEVRA